jgi:hypothetical protein
MRRCDIDRQWLQAFSPSGCDGLWHNRHDICGFCGAANEQETNIMSTYPLRIADHVMEEARRAAAEDNVFLNQLLAAFIADGVGHRRAIMSLKQRAARGTEDAALAILDRAPDTEPDPGDAMAKTEAGSLIRP